MRIAKWGLAILLASLVGTADGQQQTQEQAENSIAAAARRARENKKEHAKPTKVWDNDNIPTSAASLSVVGKAPPADNSANQPANVPPGSAAPGAANSASADASKKSAVEADLAAAKERLQTLQNDLDIAQRKITLDRQVYYSKPDYAADKAGAATLEDEQSQLEAKRQEVADAKKRVADLEEKLNSAGQSGTSSAPK
ncbi:MAG TPA: hypothetical protein VN044_10190 [Verrucomicrobiae bacterium]|jgi:hypothetical protein|nr:hypothetical protein [Verrucomicrobiae bacterium]